jgi:membrane-bound serine protease (ClpP class)
MPIQLSDPNIAFLLLLVGALGVFWEMHAPGMIVPGLIGVILICASAYGLYEDTPTWYGLLLLALALILLGVELKIYTHFISGIAGAVFLCIGALVLLHGPQRITPSLAIGVSVAFAGIAIFLSVLGDRARREKHLTGMESLIGTTGTSRTDVNPNGTVFVNGEYWSARSDHSIRAGTAIKVEHVDGLVLVVKEA